MLKLHSWPGNVRELENVIYRSAVIAQGDAILVKDLPAEIRGATGVEPTVAALGASGSEAPFESTRTSNAESVALATAKVVAEGVAVTPSEPGLTLERAFEFIYAELGRDGEAMLARAETELIRRAVASVGGDIGAAAKALGLTKVALQKRLKD
jgi:DNA-binding NtrC family response regulator